MTSFPDELRKKLIEAAVMALPLALINGLVIWLMSRFSSQPWQVLWVVVPLTFLGLIIWLTLTAPGKYVLGKQFSLLLAIYVLIFSLIAGTELLNWRRDLGGYEKEVPRNFLSLNWAGDWRYWLIREIPPTTDLAVVTMEPPEELERGRLQLADFIRKAISIPVKGIAVDAYFDKASRLDSVLCRAIDEARGKNIPVFVGYNFEIAADGKPGRIPVAEKLAPCLPDENQGHLVGYRELDGKVRMVPLDFVKRPGMESLSLRVSKAFDPTIQTPRDGLLQFVKPAEAFPEIKLGDVDVPNQRLVLRDRFLLVGVRSDKDSFSTPYGRFPGVVIHSFVVHSLRQNHYLQRTPWWSSLIVVFVSCYLVTLFFAQRWSTRRAFLMTVAVSGAICLLAILAAVVWLVWLDIIYPLVAIWILFLILIVLRRKFEKRTPTPATS